ncbi:hypothetical protein FJT64_026391 [Amphibalanus amphitrite]|uniref:Uncharacterized protein n=1 Tax=Amphibalanus amphitrite TaxID=1232801 RepID=A0A6A4WGT5_AMPAM|nr:hypothetical protein FJT64_026391 [Amphibalanus amphitrite]
MTARASSAAVGCRPPLQAWFEVRWRRDGRGGAVFVAAVTLMDGGGAAGSRAGRWSQTHGRPRTNGYCRPPCFCGSAGPRTAAAPPGIAALQGHPGCVGQTIQPASADLTTHCPTQASADLMTRCPIRASANRRLSPLQTDHTI